MGWKRWSLVLDGLRTCLCGIWNFKKNKVKNISVFISREDGLLVIIIIILPICPLWVGGKKITHGRKWLYW